MSNRLEQFIRDNREAFDGDEPGPELWRNLERNLPGRENDMRVFHLNFLRWTAAAAILVMIAGMFYYMKQQKETTSFTSNETSETTDQILSDLDPSYAKQVYHLTELVSLKQDELKQVEKEQPELYSQFVKDIHKLDSSYQALKIELPKNPNRELLLEAMIENLKLQTELLNQQLYIIKQFNQKNIKDHESISKSI